jgi:hypothetical protein
VEQLGSYAIAISLFVIRGEEGPSIHRGERGHLQRIPQVGTHNRLELEELGDWQVEALGCSQPLLLSQLEISAARPVGDRQGELSRRLAAGSDRQTARRGGASLSRAREPNAIQGLWD